MSAEILRRAAALMRERAAGATSGPWVSGRVHAGGLIGMVVAAPTEPTDGDSVVVVADILLPTNAQHIAAADPPFMLAVADWPDTAGADLWAHGPLHCADGCDECDDDLWMPHARRALAVARAYLGSES
jgi:hypothetical protein